jgi:hypothetical protein
MIEQTNEIARKIANDLGLQYNDDAPVELLLEMIATKVLEYLEHDTELLFSYLYRLDIKEQKVDQALSLRGDKPPHLAIAELILERQIERAKTKRDIKQDPIEGWEMW